MNPATDLRKLFGSTSTIDTHGVSRIPTYVELLRLGKNKAKPNFKLTDRKAGIDFDADFGLGQVAGSVAMNAALERAKSSGVAFVTIRNSGHLGALGYFTRRLAEHGMLACLMQNAAPMMALRGFKVRLSATILSHSPRR